MCSDSFLISFGVYSINIFLWLLWELHQTSQTIIIYFKLITSIEYKNYSFIVLPPIIGLFAVDLHILREYKYTSLQYTSFRCITMIQHYYRLYST